MSDPRLLWDQFRHQNLLMRRTPISAFFSLGFPLLFLVLLLALLGNETVDSRNGIRLAQLITPGVVVFGILSSTYTNLAITVPITRDEGILKRILATPLPRWIYIAGRILSATWFAVVGTVVMVAVAVLAFDVRLVARLVPALVVTLLIGAVCMCALGIAVGSLAPSGDSAPALANATFLPVAFVSGLFFPVDDAPQWVQVIGDIFPVKHFNEAMQAGFDQATPGAGFQWANLAVIVLWGALGAIGSLRWFSWEPKAPRGPSPRSRSGRPGRGRTEVAVDANVD
ncbi:MAG: ABC transporter permease [Acidimicrobiales bacterium]